MKMNRFFALLVALVCLCAFCVPSFAEGTTRFGLGDLFGMFGGSDTQGTDSLGGLFGDSTGTQGAGSLGDLFGMFGGTDSYGSTGNYGLGDLFGMYGDTGSYGSTGDYGLGDLFGMYGDTGSYGSSGDYAPTGDYSLSDLFGMFGGTDSTGDLVLEEEVITPEPTATPEPEIETVIDDTVAPKPELLTGKTVSVTVNGQKYKAHKAFRDYLDDLSELIDMSYEEFRANTTKFEAALQAYEDYTALNSELLSWKNVSMEQGDAAYYIQTVVTVLTAFINAIK